MKKSIVFLTGLLCVMISCNDKKEASITLDTLISEDYTAYGDTVTSDTIYYQSAIAEHYENLTEGDTIDVSFISTVNAVCKAKGCWMKVALDKDRESMIKFRNYGFFVPKDIENDTVIVQGKAFVSEVSVEEQRHFASDAGKSEDEIIAITKPKKTYSFIAEGVLIKK